MLELVTLAAVVAVVLIMAGIETGPGHSRELALVAALAAAAAAGRLVFAAIPNVQPVTMLVAIAGISLGPRAGLATVPAPRWLRTCSWARAPGRRGRCWRGASWA